MGQDHSTTAVALEVELCQSFTFGAAIEEKGKVGIPFVTDDLATRKAADWDDHVVFVY